MSLLESPQDTFTVKPSEDEDGPVYILRVPRLVDRSRYNHAIVSSGARFAGNIEMMRELEAAVARMLCEPEDTPQRERLIGYCQTYADEFRQWLDKKGEAPEMPAELKAAWDEMSRVDPRFAGLVADRVVYTEKAAIIAVRMFMVGWDGIDVPFRRTAMGVPDDLIACIEVAHLYAISDAVASRMTPSEARLKNFGSRSGGPHSPASSATTETPHPTVQ